MNPKSTGTVVVFNVNTRWIGFSLFSLCLHFAILSLLWQETPFKYGAAGNAKYLAKANSVLTAGIVMDETGRRQTILTKPLETATISHLKDPVKEKVSVPLPEIIETTDVDSETKLVANPGIVQEYFPVGSLTRLPAPASEIDLAVTSITGTPVTGEIELTVLIDAYGMVAEVTASTETEELRAFSERVAEVFKNTQFIPGEIAGIAVKSFLRITVVTEHLSHIENQ